MRAARPLALTFLALILAGCQLPGGPSRIVPYYEEVVHAQPFTDLVIEIDHAPGRAPDAQATEHLLQTLRNVTSKARVSVLLQQSLADDPSRVWTSDELITLERDTRTTRHEAPIAVLHVLYPAGRHENGDAAGVTISGPVIGPVVVFLDKLRELTTPAGPFALNPTGAVATMERSTLLHEAGHAMGLVDNGLPQVRDREDPASPGHSKNTRSVMYARVEETSGLRRYLLGEEALPDLFDDDDRADLRSAGGR